MLSTHRTCLRIPRPPHTLLLGYTLLLILHSQAQRWWQALTRALEKRVPDLIGDHNCEVCSQVRMHPVPPFTRPVWQLGHAVWKVCVPSGAKTDLLYKGRVLNSSCCNLAPDHTGQSGWEKRKKRGWGRQQEGTTQKTILMAIMADFTIVLL